METLGEDLVLLAIRPSGVTGTSRLRYGLAGSELIRLAALGRADVEHGRIILLYGAPAGDTLLDEALTSMRGRPAAKDWVARDRGDQVRQYLERLTAAGTIELQHRKALGVVPSPAGQYWARGGSQRPGPG